jgi:hypothetical protein
MGVNLFSSEQRPFALMGNCGISEPTGYAVLLPHGKMLLQLDGNGAHFVNLLGEHGALPQSAEPALVRDALSYSQEAYWSLRTKGTKD